ncbi:MAG: serine hydroxymethyltransferase, partial [Patescibacteria group bacterium]
TGKLYNTIMYHVKPDGRIDMEEVWKLAKEHKPKLIWMGATAYMYKYEYDKFAEVADSIGAYLVADIAHIAGLILSGVHTNPVKHAHIVTTTTHKTLRGPRGGMIMVTDKGLQKDPDLGKKIDSAIFPGLQGGPHDHQTAAIATALKEAGTPRFRKYAIQIVSNAKTLADELKKAGISLIGKGTENHLLLLNLVPTLGAGGGLFLQDALGAVRITANKNTIPLEPMSPYYPSGVRMGTPALTSRGMKNREMKKIAQWIVGVIEEIKKYKMPFDKEERKLVIGKFRKEISVNRNLKLIAKEVTALCKKFPIKKVY